MLCMLGPLQIRAAAASTADGDEPEVAAGPLPPPPVVKESLLRATAKARKDKPEETEAEKQIREEAEMLADMQKRTALKGVKELAKVILSADDKLGQCWWPICAEDS